jgi:hypothetical protein
MNFPEIRPTAATSPYICIFMVVAVLLACTSITDQLWIQMAFMTARFVMAILMVGTVVGAYGAKRASLIL